MNLLEQISSPLTVFVSSTYLDLKYERRFVINWLRAHGFHVIAMEDLHGRSLYWQEWSQNSARKCDIYLRLFDRRVGASPPFLSFGASFSEIERRFAVENAILMLSYELRRPLSDWQMLVSNSNEQEDYLKTFDISESPRGLDAARIVERSFRKGTKVSSVADLEANLRRDLQMSAVHQIRHRLRLWRREYFNHSRAWCRLAFEDEHVMEESRRPRFSTTQRVVAIILAISGFWGLAHSTSAADTVAITIIVVIVCAAATIAWGPAFIYVGTKALVARGAFGLRTLQQPKGREGLLLPRWKLLDKWCHIGAASVIVPEGRRVFVPFISNAVSLAHAAEQAPRPDPVPDRPPTEEETAEMLRRIREFAESLGEEE